MSRIDAAAAELNAVESAIVRAETGLKGIFPLFEGMQAEAVRDYLASPEAEKALAEALDSYRGECSDPEFHRDTARAILAAWLEKL